MSKSARQANPGRGGTYMMDPQTGERRLVRPATRRVKAAQVTALASAAPAKPAKAADKN